MSIVAETGKVLFLFILHYCFISFGLLAFDDPEEVVPETEKSVPKVFEESKGPLSVPVFPRSENMSKALPEGADLRDSYIQLEDGSVLSVADWILGGVRKDSAGAGMSDYESRLFLGQVARAMVGMDENMVNRSLVHARPTRTYVPVQNAPALEAAEWIFRSILLPGTPKNYSPATTGGAFSPTMITGNTGTASFEDEFLRAINTSRDDFRETGTLMNMLNGQKKRMEASRGTSPGSDSAGPQQ